MDTGNGFSSFSSNYSESRIEYYSSKFSRGPRRYRRVCRHPLLGFFWALPRVRCNSFLSQFVVCVYLPTLPRAADHPVRHQFSLQIVNRNSEVMRDYWDTQYFQGVSPSYALASVEALIQFVASTPGVTDNVPAHSVNAQVKILMLLPLAPLP